MRELAIDELDAVSGGILPLLAIAVIAILVLPGCAGGPDVKVDVKAKVDVPGPVPPIEGEINVEIKQPAGGGQPAPGG